jgi:thioredoxin 1
LVDPSDPVTGGPQCVATAADVAIWAAFAVDYVARLYLAPARWRFVRSHLLDLLVLVVPFLRPLRALGGELSGIGARPQTTTIRRLPLPAMIEVSRRQPSCECARRPNGHADGGGGMRRRGAPFIPPGVISTLRRHRMATVALTQDTVEQTLIDNDIVLVDFWAGWCGPCRRFAPTFERAAQAYPEIVFAKVDTEAERELAAWAGIKSIPTLMVFREQALVFSQPGALPEPALIDLIEQVRTLDMAAVPAQVERAASA